MEYRISPDANAIIASDTRIECRSKTTGVLHNRFGPAVLTPKTNAYYVDGICLTKALFVLCSMTNGSVFRDNYGNLTIANGDGIVYGRKSARI